MPDCLNNYTFTKEKRQRLFQVIVNQERQYINDCTDYSKYPDDWHEYMICDLEMNKDKDWYPYLFVKDKLVFNTEEEIKNYTIKKVNDFIKVLGYKNFEWNESRRGNNKDFTPFPFKIENFCYSLEYPLSKENVIGYAVLGYFTVKDE